MVESPLHLEHKRLEAKLVDFAGWQMPLQFTGVLDEHRAVRGSAGLFDVSHLGKLTVKGTGAAQALDQLMPGRVAELTEGTAGYNLVLNQRGGVVDDVFLYRLSDQFIVIPNAANNEAVRSFLEGSLPQGIEVTDAGKTWGFLALSGPKARQVVRSLDGEAAELKVHQVAELTSEGRKLIVARTGYTGEYTCEFLVEWDESAWLWKRLLALGGSDVRPAGLGARDTLRLEMGYPLHGHEIAEDVNPLEAGLGWVIRWDKPDFHGKKALEEIRAAESSRKLVGLLAVEKGIPRAGQRILVDSHHVGDVTSGNISPMLGVGIALGYVRAEHCTEGTMLTIDVRGRSLQVKVVKPPFIEN